MDVSRQRCTLIPCRIVGKSVTVETDVVKSGMPLKNNIQKLILPMIKSIYLIKKLIYDLHLVDIMLFH